MMNWINLQSKYIYYCRKHFDCIFHTNESISKNNYVSFQNYYCPLLIKPKAQEPSIHPPIETKGLKQGSKKRNSSTPREERGGEEERENYLVSWLGWSSR